MKNNADSNIVVTVGIACYNQASFLPDTINSILNQTYPHLEIIISDDSSTDNTSQIVEPYLNDKRIKYFKNPANIGRVANYRKLLYEYATGSWYINIDGDDQLIDNNFINEAIEQVIRDNQVVMVSAACKRQIGNKTEYIISSEYNDEITKIDGAVFFINFKSKLSWISHLTTVYNVDKAKTINFYNADITSTDYESLFRLSLLGKVVSFKKVVGLWNIHGENESVQSKIDGNKILKNFVYIEGPAAFAKAYLPASEVRSWRITMLKNEIVNNFSFLMLFRPLNWKYSIWLIFKRYPIITLNIMPVIFKSAAKKLIKREN